MNRLSYARQRHNLDETGREGHAGRIGVSKRKGLGRGVISEAALVGFDHACFRRASIDLELLGVAWMF